jgi:hypothetical protein
MNIHKVVLHSFNLKKFELQWRAMGLFLSHIVSVFFRNSVIKRSFSTYMAVLIPVPVLVFLCQSAGHHIWDLPINDYSRTTRVRGTLMW